MLLFKVKFKHKNPRVYLTTIYNSLINIFSNKKIYMILLSKKFSLNDILIYFVPLAVVLSILYVYSTHTD